jgi:hypothetical protein
MALTGFENMSTVTLVKAAKEVRRGPMSAKAELLARAMDDELTNRGVSKNHPVFALASRS